VLHLERDEVAALIARRDFPFALTIAVASDMDGQENWHARLSLRR
jgi:hypothetical protein